VRAPEGWLLPAPPFRHVVYADDIEVRPAVEQHEALEKQRKPVIVVA
jgi:hypothetical protein